MPDTLTSRERSERMSRIGAKNSKTELIVRKLSHRLGFRFRLHRRDLPGTPDLVFPRLKSVIFVHGCFWHRHTDPACHLARLPKSRLDFWGPKLEGNRSRDLRNQAHLAKSGWRVLVLWECELNRKDHLESTIRTFLEGACRLSNSSPEPAASESASPKPASSPSK